MGTNPDVGIVKTGKLPVGEWNRESLLTFVFPPRRCCSYVPLLPREPAESLVELFLLFPSPLLPVVVQTVVNSLRGVLLLTLGLELPPLTCLGLVLPTQAQRPPSSGVP